MMRGRTRENQGDINNLLGMDKLDFKLESNLDIYNVLQKFGINTPNYITIQTGSGRCWENIKMKHGNGRKNITDVSSDCLKINIPKFKLFKSAAKNKPQFQVLT